MSDKQNRLPSIEQQISNLSNEMKSMIVEIESLRDQLAIVTSERDALGGNDSKLEWMKKYRLTVSYVPSIVKVHSGKVICADTDYQDGFGNSDDEAIIDWAKRSNVPLWNKKFVPPIPQSLDELNEAVIDRSIKP